MLARAPIAVTFALMAAAAMGCGAPEQGDARIGQPGVVGGGATTDANGTPPADAPAPATDDDVVGGGTPDTDTAKPPDGGGDASPGSDAGEELPADPGADLDPGGADDAASDPGADDTAPDGGAACPDPTLPAGCDEASFSFLAPGGAAEVLVSGSFNGWPDSVASGGTPLADGDGDGRWETTARVGGGRHLYKFVVRFGDGRVEWHADPENPERTDDGWDNSVVVVTPCPSEENLQLLSHRLDGRAFEAVATSGADRLAAADVELTVDFAPAPDGSLSIHCDELRVRLVGLADGIHDVQLRRRGADRVDALHLKVVVGQPVGWEGTLIYFAMTDRFRNGDAGNDDPFDVHPAIDYQGGDFAGVTAALEEGYFDSLGVGAIWISWPAAGPDRPEPGRAGEGEGCFQDPKQIPGTDRQYTGYHGYWPAQRLVVEPRFGTLEELRAMVQAAHARGIRVLLDYTANHVHTDSPYYQEFSDAGRFNQPVDVCADSDWQRPVSCWFTGFLADLNTRDPSVVDDLLEMATWWVKETGADGFRVDAVKHVDADFWRSLRQRMDAEFAQTGVPFAMIGETFSGNPEELLPFQGEDRLHGQFDFPLNFQVLEKIAFGRGSLADMDSAVRGAHGRYGGALMSPFVGNHDISRFISAAAGDAGCGPWDVITGISRGWRDPPGPPDDDAPYQRLRIALAYALTQPGAPLLYYGDEFGMPGAGDPDNRRMMRFGDDLSGREAATLAWTRTLGTLRRTSPVVALGSRTEPLWAEADLLVYARVDGTAAALVALNTGNSERTVTLDLAAAGVPAGAFSEAFSDRSASSDGGLVTLSLPAFAPSIWVKDP